jgi:hypothetical protein
MLLERELDDLDCALDAGAEAAGGGDEDPEDRKRSHGRTPYAKFGAP